MLLQKIQTLFKYFSLTNKKIEKNKIYLTFLVKLTLEELYTDCIKPIKINYNIIGPFSKIIISISKIIILKIKKGWKSGQRVSFILDNYHIIFIIEEITHSYYRRDTNNLTYICNLIDSQYNKGHIISIPTLNKKNIKLSKKNIQKGDCLIYYNQGMPLIDSNEFGYLKILIT
jgi:hypothetical protein